MDSRPAMAIFELLDYIVNEVCALGLRVLLSGSASPPWVFPGAGVLWAAPLQSPVSRKPPGIFCMFVTQSTQQLRREA